MIKGYVENTTGRARHIFKQSVTPGEKVTLDQLYEVYRRQYNGNLDLEFVDWLKDNKVPEDWSIVVNQYVPEKDPTKSLSEEDSSESLNPPSPKSMPSRVIEKPLFQKKPAEKITAAELAGLKHKDNPKQVIQRISSIYKLRRALTMCNGKKGKALLRKYIHARIDELK